MRGGKIVLLISGLLLSLLGLGLAGAGVTIGALHLFQRDADGFVTTWAVEMDSDGHAITAKHNWAPWLEQFDLRLRATPSAEDEPIFLGIAARSEGERYLAELVRNDAVVPGTPDEQTFWTASTQGAGTQSLVWPAEAGRWSILIMNADASPGVDVEVDVGAQIGAPGPIALALLLLAAALLAGGTATIVSALPRAERASTAID